MIARTRTRLYATAVVAAVLLVPGSLVASETPADPASKASDRDLLYALGVVLAGNLEPLALGEDEIAAVQEGIADATAGKDLRVDPRTLGGQLDAYLRGRVKAEAERRKKAGTEFVEKAALAPGALRTDSGLVYLEREAGDGPSPGPTDTVRIHYTGTFPDGTVFDTSRAGDVEEPAEFRLDQVIQCFGEGIQRMKVGGSARLVCPPDIAYGDRGFPPKILPGDTLAFEVELLGIVEPPAESTTGEAGDEAGQ